MTDLDTDNRKSRTELWQYAGIGGQMLISLGIGVFAGLKLDKWMTLKFPLLIWLLPSLILVAMIARVIKATSKRK